MNVVLSLFPPLSHAGAGAVNIQQCANHDILVAIFFCVHLVIRLSYPYYTPARIHNAWHAPGSCSDGKSACDMECKRPMCSDAVALAVTALIPTLRQTRADSVNMFFFFSLCPTVYSVFFSACNMCIQFRTLAIC